MPDQTAPDGLPIYELDDPEAPYGLSAFGGGYVIVRPPADYEPPLWARMDDPPLDGLRLRVSSDRVTESVIRDGQVISERDLNEVPECWPDKQSYNPT